MKPLFIPLKTEYYRAFENGTKPAEYRPYGKRWNEQSCYLGRPVVLARGYSTPDRLNGRIIGFSRTKPCDLPSDKVRADWVACYGSERSDVAAIVIEVIR